MLLAASQSTLTSSLKRSWRLMSERRRPCFSSCSSSESGCLKYSIKSFSVWSTSSMYPATAVESPSAVLSRALRGRTGKTKETQTKKELPLCKCFLMPYVCETDNPCYYLIKLVKSSVVLRMMRAARDSSCWQRWRVNPSSMWPSECRQA